MMLIQEEKLSYYEVDHKILYFICKEICLLIHSIYFLLFSHIFTIYVDLRLVYEMYQVYQIDHFITLISFFFTFNYFYILM